MRLDKLLKVSRLIKRRTVANKVCASEKIYINDKIAKPSATVNLNDIITIKINEKTIKVKVINILNISTKESAKKMYEIV